MFCGILGGDGCITSQRLLFCHVTDVFRDFPKNVQVPNYKL